MLEEDDKTLYVAYFQRNADYYIKQLDHFNEKGRCTFNVPAFFSWYILDGISKNVYTHTYDFWNCLC